MGKYSTYVYTWPDSQECEECKNGVLLMNEDPTDREVACKEGYRRSSHYPCTEFQMKE